MFLSVNNFFTKIFDDVEGQKSEEYYKNPSASNHRALHLAPLRAVVMTYMEHFR